MGGAINAFPVCACRKLKYLSRIGAKEDGISYRAFSSLVDEVESLCLVKECRELEERYKVDYTSKILVSQPEDRHVIIKEMESCSLPQSTNIFARSLIRWDGRNYGTTLLTMAKPVSLP